MPGTLQCISPIDGSLYVERPMLDAASARSAAAKAADAQRAWERVPMAERIARVLEGVRRLGDMNTQVTTELA